MENLAFVAYIIAPVDYTCLLLNRFVNLILEQLDQRLMISQLFNNEGHIFLNDILLALIELITIVKIQETLPYLG